MVEQAVTADDAVDLVNGAPVCDEFVHGRHVDSVHVRVTNGGRSGGEVHFACSDVAGHLDDLCRGGSAHDGIIHQQNGLAFEFMRDSRELSTDGFLSKGLAGHDEGPANVTVLHEPFTVDDAKGGRKLKGSNSPRIWNWNDGVDVMIWPRLKDSLGQPLALV